MFVNVEPDWLLIYKILQDRLILRLIRTGSHSDLFRQKNFLEDFSMEYTHYTLADLVKIKYGKNQKKVLSDSGVIPIYGTGGLMGYATEALYDKPSVLIGRKGTINKVKYIEEPFWTVDTLFYTEVNDSIIQLQ